MNIDVDPAGRHPKGCPSEIQSVATSKSISPDRSLLHVRAPFARGAKLTRMSSKCARPNVVLHSAPAHQRGFGFSSFASGKSCSYR